MNLNKLTSRKNCWDHLIRLFRYKEEKSFFRWLLNHLEKFICCCLMHFFRQPDYHYLKVRFEGLKTQLFYYFRGFRSKYHSLGIPDFNGIHPAIESKIWGLLYKFPPFVYIIVTDRICGFLSFYNRKDKMKIGMNKFLIFYTRFTC